MKIHLTITKIIITSILICNFSCTKEESIIQNDSASENILDNSKSITTDDLLKFENYLTNQGHDVSALSVKDIIKTDKNGRYNSNGVNNGIFLKSIKVQYKITNPNTGNLITCSGVILVPHNRFKSYRIIVSSPPTYTLNSTAPSNFFENFMLNIFSGKEHETIYLYALALQAAQGFAVFIPDYPGYGDSHGKIFHPYLVKDIMVDSNIKFFMAAKEKLNNLGYSTKNEILVEGYSQGALISSQFTRELETNPTKYGIKVLALSSGGTPANLLDIITTAKKSKILIFPTLLPLSYHGFQKNGLINLPISTIIKEPYASSSINYYNGYYGLLLGNIQYPKIVDNFFTHSFINADLKTDTFFKPLTDVLINNSLKPWINQCEFKMFHGRIDQAVYFDQAYNYALEHNKNGGKVTFTPVIGEHIIAMLPFYLGTAIWFNKYK